jgi:hypothetical protein
MLPRAAEALVATAERLEDIGWVFPPPAGVAASGVAVLFYHGFLVDVESYAILATHIASLGHAVVLITTTEIAVADRQEARACYAAAAAGAYTRSLFS